MNIVQVGTDTHIFDKTSRTFARMRAYSEVFGSLTIVIPVTSKDFVEVSEGSLHVYPAYGANKAIALFALLFELRKRVGKGAIVYAQDAFEIGLIAFIISKLKGASLVTQVHTDFLSPYFAVESPRRRLQVLLAKFLTRHSLALRVVSTRVKTSLVSSLKIPASDIFVLPILYDSPTVQQEREVGKGDALSFLILSRLTIEKNVAMAIKAFLNVKKVVNKKITLTIAGDGSLRSELESLASDDSDIKFLGWQRDLSSTYSGSDCLLLPSMYEGYSLNVLEAAGYSVPTIMTDVGCAGDFLVSGENGIVVPVGDEKSFVEAIKSVVDIPSSLTSMGIKSREKLATFSNQDKYLADMKKMFKEIEAKK